MVIETPVVQVQHQAFFPPLVYALSVFIIVVFAVIAVIYSFKDPGSTENIENFTQAKKSAGLFTLIWGYYGAHVGAWIIFVPPQFAGYLGGGFLSCGSLFLYTALAPIVVALGGLLIRRVSPSILSFPSFCRQRFGEGTFIFVLLIMTFNMCVGLLAEYTAIGQLFKYFVDPTHVIASPDVFIVVITAILVALYTAVGGLKISIITDQFQGILSIVLTVVIVIYIAVKFRYPLTRENLNGMNLGKSSFVGASSYGSQIAYVFQSFYSEDLWQRNYAAKNLRVQVLAATIGGLIAGVQEFFFAIIGTLVAWAGLNRFDEQGNLTFFQIFLNDESSWAAVIVVLIAVSMNCSLVDSYQNALISCLAQIYLSAKSEIGRFNRAKNNVKSSKDQQVSHNKEVDSYNKYTTYDSKDIQDSKTKDSQRPTNFRERLSILRRGFFNTVWLRLVVLLLQAVLIPVSLQGYNISGLNFVVLIITCFLFVPNFLGLLLSPKYYNGIQGAVAICLSVVAPHIYAYFILRNHKGPFPYSSRNVMRYVWLGKFNSYDYAIFISILATGICSSIILVSIAVIVRKIQGQVRGFSLKQDLFQYKLSI